MSPTPVQTTSLLLENHTKHEHRTSHYKYDMTDEEAIELGKRAIYHATHRDAYSGSINNVYIVKPTGWVKVHAGDVNDMHYKLAEEKAAITASRAGAEEKAP